MPNYCLARAENIPLKIVNECLTVVENRKEIGFWKAYKYFYSCREWYEEKLDDYFFYWDVIDPDMLDYVYNFVADKKGCDREMEYVCISPLEPKFAWFCVLELILCDRLRTTATSRIQADRATPWEE